MNLMINEQKNPRIQFTIIRGNYPSCVIFWWLWNAYASEWDKQCISMPLGKIDPIHGGLCIHFVRDVEVDEGYGRKL